MTENNLRTIDLIIDDMEFTNKYVGQHNAEKRSDPDDLVKIKHSETDDFPVLDGEGNDIGHIKKNSPGRYTLSYDVSNEDKILDSRIFQEMLTWEDHLLITQDTLNKFSDFLNTNGQKDQIIYSISEDKTQINWNFADKDSDAANPPQNTIASIEKNEDDTLRIKFNHPTDCPHQDNEILKFIVTSINKAKENLKDKSEDITQKPVFHTFANQEEVDTFSQYLSKTDIVGGNIRLEDNKLIRTVHNKDQNLGEISKENGQFVLKLEPIFQDKDQFKTNLRNVITAALSSWQTLESDDTNKRISVEFQLKAGETLDDVVNSCKDAGLLCQGDTTNGVTITQNNQEIFHIDRVKDETYTIKYDPKDSDLIPQFISGRSEQIMEVGNLKDDAALQSFCDQLQQLDIKGSKFKLEDNKIFKIDATGQENEIGYTLKNKDGDHDVNIKLDKIGDNLLQTIGNIITQISTQQPPVSIDKPDPDPAPTQTPAANDSKSDAKKEGDFPTGELAVAGALALTSLATHNMDEKQQEEHKNKPEKKEGVAFKVVKWVTLAAALTLGADAMFNKGAALKYVQQQTSRIFGR